MEFLVGCVLLLGLVMLRSAFPGRKLLESCPSCDRQLDEYEQRGTTCSQCDALLPTPPQPRPNRALALVGAACMIASASTLGMRFMQEPGKAQPAAALPTAEVIQNTQVSDKAFGAYQELALRATRDELTADEYRAIVPLILDQRDRPAARRHRAWAYLMFKAHEAGAVPADAYARYAAQSFMPMQLEARPCVEHGRRVPVWIQLRSIGLASRRDRRYPAKLEVAFRHARWEIDGQVVEGAQREWAWRHDARDTIAPLPEDAPLLWFNPSRGSIDAHPPTAPPLAPGRHTVRLTTEFRLLSSRDAIDTPLHAWEQTAEASFEVLAPGEAASPSVRDLALAASLVDDIRVVTCRANPSTFGDDRVALSLTMHVPPRDVGLAFELSIVQGDRRWLLTRHADTRAGRIATFVIDPRDTITAFSAETLYDDFDARSVDVLLRPVADAAASTRIPVAVLDHVIVIRDVPVAWSEPRARR